MSPIIKGNIKLCFVLLASLIISMPASAHNAVSYISEEAIIVGFVLSIIALISLICAILGLFKTNRFIKVSAIIGAVMSTMILAFVSSARGFKFFIPFTLIITFLMWLAVYFRKVESTKSKAPSAIKIGLLESMAFSTISWILIINIHQLVPSQNMRSTVLFSGYAIIVSVIFYFGHRNYFKRLLKKDIIPTLSDGMKITVCAILSFWALMLVYSVLLSLIENYGILHFQSLSKVLAIGSIPALIIGALVTYLITPKTSNSH